MLIAGVALGLTIYIFSRQLWGRVGAFVSLGLFVTSPAMLAHGPIAQSDVFVTWFSLLTLAASWSLLHRLTPVRLIFAGLMLGGAVLSKFSAALLAPALLGLLIARIVMRRPLRLEFFKHQAVLRNRLAIAAVSLLALVGQVLIATGTIWASFNFRYSAFPAEAANGRFIAEWDWALQRNDLLTKTIATFREHRLLPEAYLYGLAFLHQRNTFRPAFLCGRYYDAGTYAFFPACVLLKTPPGLLLVALFACASFVSLWLTERRSLRASMGVETASIADESPSNSGILYATMPYWLFASLFTFVAVASRLNNGDRYILPCYAPFMVLAGSLGAWLTRRHLAVTTTSKPSHDGRRTWHWGASVAAVACFIATAAEDVAAWPHYLAYVTPIVGGSACGDRYLVDGAFDWGQDLSRLAPRIAAIQAPRSSPLPVYLAYFGTASPHYYEVNARPLPRALIESVDRPTEPLTPGIYCLSVTELRRLYGHQCGPWNKLLEARYREMSDVRQRLATADVVERREIFAEHPEAATPLFSLDFADLEYSRLCHYLLTREPDDRAGHTILIYVLDEASLHAALHGPLPSEHGS